MLIEVTILCATDFSPSAFDAMWIAAQLAGSTGQKLSLLHCVEPRSGDLGGYAGAGELEEARRRLDEEAATLTGVRVETETVAAWPAVAIVVAASQRSAGLIVLGAVGNSSGTRPLIGGVAECVAHITPVPLLLVHDRTTLEPWIHDRRALQLLICGDWENTSGTPTDWLNTLAPLSASAILHVGHDAAAAASGGYDLIAVSMQERRRDGSIWHNSVPHAVIHQVPSNIVCVPSRKTHADAEALKAHALG